MHLTPRIMRGLAGAAASSLTLAGLVTLAPMAQAAGEGLIINEFYGRGGSANQPFTHKFVELYNPTGAAVELDGTSLQYRSATGTGNASGTTALSGSVAPGGYYLVQLNSNGGSGEALPTPDHTAGFAPSGTTGTIFLAESTSAINPDRTDLVIDKLGYGGSNSPEGTAAPYPGRNSDPGSLNRTDFVDTDNNAADFTFSAEVTPQNSGDGGTDPEPDPVEVTIAQIQGTGAETPYRGQEVITEGVVPAAYPTGGFRGVYIQTPGSGGTPKAPRDASDGIFLFSDSAAANLEIGDCVEVEGVADEYFGLTQLRDVLVDEIEGCEAVTPTALATLPVTDAEKEVYEGMLVHPRGPTRSPTTTSSTSSASSAWPWATSRSTRRPTSWSPVRRRRPTRQPTRRGTSLWTTARRGTT